jgi:hypothetical protein
MVRYFFNATGRPNKMHFIAVQRGFAPALTYTEEDVGVLITKLRRAIQLACSEIF